VSEDVEQAAERIAGRGREALLARLRPAFEEAAKAHADVLELDDEQLEEMVQRAADRADGLQWRRALAAVATEELGIGLGEALGHPAVERAQQIVGAPSYEESLAQLGPLPERRVETAAREEPVAEEHEEDEEDEAGQPEEPEAGQPEEDEAGQPEEPEEHEPEQAGEPEDEPRDEPKRAAEPRTLRLAAVHLGGIANLAPAQSDIQLRFSRAGVDVVRDPDSILGRLAWDEVRNLEVPDPRGWRRKRKQHGAHLVLRTEHGDASFEIPALTPEELREHLKPVSQYFNHS
jgi:hypothetical protein